MLTKSDLSKIGELIRNETTPIIQQELAPVKEDIRSLKTDVKSLKEDVGVLKKDVGSLKKDMRYVKKTADVMIRFFDKQDVELNKRVTRVETHLGLATP